MSVTIYGHANHNAKEYDYVEIRDLVKVLGGFAFNARSLESYKISMRMRDEIGGRLCLGLHHEAGDWEWGDNAVLLDRLYPVRGCNPNVVKLHWEMPKDPRRTQPSLDEWKQVTDTVRVFFPRVPIVCYDWPGYNCEKVIYGPKDNVPLDRAKVFDFSACSLYSSHSRDNQWNAWLSLMEKCAIPAIQRDEDGKWDRPAASSVLPLYCWLWPAKYDDACIADMGKWIASLAKLGWLTGLHVYPGLCEAGDKVELVHDRLRRLVEAIG